MTLLTILFFLAWHEQIFKALFEVISVLLMTVFALLLLLKEAGKVIYRYVMK